jgi:hypothetical protein
MSTMLTAALHQNEHSAARPSPAAAHQHSSPVAHIAAAARPSNHATLRRLAQTKLAVSKPGDAHEQEADRVADAVLRVQEPAVQRACACGGACESCRGEHKQTSPDVLQPKPAGAVTAPPAQAPPAVHDVLGGSGRPLDAGTRAFFEPRLGYDLSRVRVHTDTRAAESAHSLNALAYTVGRDIAFASGQYEPGTDAGKHLLAHELTHVMQQAGGGPAPPMIHRQPAPPKPSPWRACGTGLAKLTAAAAKAKSQAPNAVSGMKALIAKWGSAPTTVEERASARALATGFAIEFDKSDWVTLGIATKAEVDALNKRDRPILNTILANFQQIEADIANYTAAPECATRPGPSGTPCFGCASADNYRCKTVKAQAFVLDLGKPSSPVYVCPDFFTTFPDPVVAGEALLHELAHLQAFAASDKFMGVRYYGCPVFPIDQGPGLTEPSQFITIADSYRCFLETQRLSAAAFTEADRIARESRGVTRGVTGP